MMKKMLKMMKRMRREFSMSGGRTLAVLAVVSLAACTSMNVQSDYDRDMSFGDLRTYEWIEADSASAAESGLGFDSPLMGRRIQESVDTVLASRGYRRASSGPPDFRISYRMVAREEIQHLGSGHSRYSPYRHRFGHGHGHRFGHGFGHGNGSSLARDVVRCVLVLDVWDRRSGELVWRGWARWRLGADPSPEKVARHLDQAVQRILSRLPPGAGEALPPVAEG